MTAPRRPRRSRAELARLQPLALAAAVQLFSLEGADAVTLRRIAETLDVGIAALYRHFPSKTHLLRAVWDELLAASLRAASQAAAAEPDRWRRPAAFVDGFIGYWLAHPERYLLVFTAGNEQLAVRLGFPPYGLQQAVQQHFRAAALLIEGCSTRRIDDEVMAALLEMLFCRSFGLLHPVLYFPSYPWRDIGAMRRALADEITRELRRALRR